MYKGDSSKGEIEIIKENKVFENKFCEFFDDDVKFPSGAKGNYLRLKMKGNYSVAILPITKDGEMVFVKTFRHSARGWGYEVPKGYGTEDELPEICARRELLEETGLRSDNLIYLGYYYESPSTIQNGLHCFVAVDCEQQSAIELEESEVIGGMIKIKSFKDMPSTDFNDALTEMIVCKYFINKNNAKI